MTSRLLILGDSPVALTAALTAQILGFKPHLIRSDRTDSKLAKSFKGADPRAWSLTASSMNFLYDVGLGLQSKANVVQMDVWHADVKGSPLPGRVLFSGTKKHPLSAIVPNQELRHELEAQVEALGIEQEVLAPQAILPDPVRLRKDRNAALALICEAAWVKALPPSQMPRANGWAYDQVALTAPVALDTPHGNTARQVFLPSGPLALLPLPDPLSASMIWSLRSSELKAALANPHLSDDVSNALGLGVSLDRETLVHFPLVSSHVDRYHGDGFVVLGDAAHRIHPLAGQGLNLGFGDVGALFDSLVAARSVGMDLGSPTALNNFIRRRRPQNEMMRAATDQFKHLFGNDFGPVRLARSLGLGLFNASPLKSRLQTWMTNPGPLCGSFPR